MTFCIFAIDYRNIKIKDRINQTLTSITAELQEINSDFYIIGASAMILSGIEVG